MVVEGTSEVSPSNATAWREYEFRGKPTDMRRRPPQVAPYHLRLDWLMWFAAMSSYRQHPWFINFVAKLLANDRQVLGLLKSNPFPQSPPRLVRASLFEYHFANAQTRRPTGNWWVRRRVGEWFPAVSLDTPSFHRILEQEGWLN